MHSRVESASHLHGEKVVNSSYGKESRGCYYDKMTHTPIGRNELSISRRIAADAGIRKTSVGHDVPLVGFLL